MNKLYETWLSYCYSWIFLWTVSIFTTSVCLIVGIKNNSISGWIGFGIIWAVLWTRFLNYRYGSSPNINKKEADE